MTPYGDQIFVRPLLPVEKTSSGLVIPDDARGRPQRGVVLAVGPGLPSELTGTPRAMQCKAGDLVLFGEFAGMMQDVNGEDVLIMRDQEALGGTPAGTFAVTSHEGARKRTVYHIAGERCEHCPEAAEETEARERLQQERERLAKERVQ